MQLRATGARRDFHSARIPLPEEAKGATRLGWSKMETRAISASALRETKENVRQSGDAESELQSQGACFEFPLVHIQCKLFAAQERKCLARERDFWDQNVGREAAGPLRT